jgi:hypothetical protein
VSDPEVKNLSLAQLSLAPSSVLMLTFLDESLNDPILKAPLTEEILAKAQDLPVPVPLDAPKDTGSGSKAKSFGAQKLDAAKAGLPKWLKLSSRGLSSCVRAIIADMKLDRKIVTTACCECWDVDYQLHVIYRVESKLCVGESLRNEWHCRVWLLPPFAFHKIGFRR